MPTTCVLGWVRPFGAPGCGRPAAARTAGRVFQSRGVSCHVARRSTVGFQEAEAEQPRTPRSLHDVDNGKILGFGADLSPEHPGYHDESYKARRVAIAKLAAEHKIGEPIPRISYTEDELNSWAIALKNLRELYPKHACAEFNEAFDAFGFSEAELPQLQDISELMMERSGWQIRPVAGLMHPRDFLNGLAFQTFHSTQYVRHHSKPHYTPEPDVVHELLGHAAMFANPSFCKLAKAIGVASLGASEKDIWHLTKVYWYTVEFGVVREAGEIKAFGAGILSSYGELTHMAEGNAELLPMDPYSPQPKMSYKDGYQKQYFVLDSFEAGAEQVMGYANSVARVPS